MLQNASACDLLTFLREAACPSSVPGSQRRVVRSWKT